MLRNDGGEAVIQRQTLLPGDQPAAELQFERDSEGTFVNLDNRNGLFRTLQLITWTGAGNTNNWSEAADWDNAPTGVPFDLGGNRLVFDGTKRLSPFADNGHGGAGNYINIGGITFAEGADPFTLRGGTLTFGKFNRGISNHSTNRQTIENDLIAPEHGLGAEWQLAVEAIDGSLTLTGSVDLQDDGYLLVTGGSNTRIAGPISGAGGLRKIGSGQLTLAGNNSYQGDTSIREGTLVAVGGNAIPDSGNVNIGSALYETRLVFENNETIGALDGGGHVWTPGGLSVINLQDHVLTITGSSQYEGFGGRIIGAGALVKTGTGTQTLAGTNTYGGSTTIKQGTLAVKGGGVIPDGSGKVIIDNHPTATFQLLSNETIFSLSGGGTQGGKVLIGNNTLTIGDGSGTANATFAGVIEGNTGLLALELGEGGRHRFEGDLKFNGRINLISGTAVFDTGTPVPGPVRNTGVLFTHNGVTGRVTNIAGGSFVLPPDGTIDGMVFNSNNALFVNSGVVDGDFVNTGWLVGSGTINGMLKNQKGGTLAPGESIGTTVVNGAYVQQSGSTLEVEVDGSGDGTPVRGDHLDVNADNGEDGSATFEKDSIIAVSLVEGGGEVRHDDIFDIVDAEGGINAPAGGLEHIQIVENFPLVDFTFQVVEAGDVLQLLAELMDFVEMAEQFGVDADQRAVAGALNSLAKENQDAPLLQAMRDTTDDGNRFLWALDEAGPQAYEMLPTITVENARLFNIALARYFFVRCTAPPVFGVDGKLALKQTPMLASRNREPGMLASAVKQTRDSLNPPPSSPLESMPGQLAAVDKNAWNVFGRTIGIFQDQDNDDDRLGYQADAGGLILGINRRIVSELVGGLGIAYIRSNTELAADRGHHDIDTVRIGPYVCYSPSPWFFDASLSYGYHQFDTERSTPISGPDVNSDHDGHDITAYARTGCNFDILESGFTATPEAALQYLYLHEEAFTESGPAALDVDSRNTDSLRSRLGLSCKYPVMVSQMRVIPEVFLGWEHEFLADDEATHAHFVSGGKTFGVDIPDARRDSASINASITAVIKKNISAYLRYDGSSHSHGETHGVSAGFRYNF